MEIREALNNEYIFENGGILYKNKKRSRDYVKVEDVMRYLSEISDRDELDWTKKQREEGIKEWKEEMKLKKNEDSINFDGDNIQKFILSTFKSNNICLIEGGTFMYDNVRMEEIDIVAKLEAAIANWNRNNPNIRISSPELKAALAELKVDKKKDYIKKMIENLMYDKECEKDLDQFLELTHKTFNISEELSIFKVVMCHWMWLVKRRIHAKSVINEIVVNFKGCQGTGKSYYIKEVLTKIFGEFRVLNAQIDSIQDPRNYHEFSSKFIHFLDEFSSSDNKKVYTTNELNCFKQIITSDALSYRILGTNNSTTIIPRTTLIGCTNKNFYNIINDSSGMRRFFEFNIQNKQNTYNDKDMEILKGLSEKAWKGIDDEMDYGYLKFNSEIGKKIQDIQETYIREDSFDVWFKSIDIVEGTMSGKAAHDLYKEFCYAEGLEYKGVQVQSFYQSLASKGIAKKMIHGYAYIDVKIVQKTSIKEEESPSTKNFINSLQNLGIQTQDDLSHTRPGKNLSNKLGGIS